MILQSVLKILILDECIHSIFRGLHKNFSKGANKLYIGQTFTYISVEIGNLWKCYYDCTIVSIFKDRIVISIGGETHIKDENYVIFDKDYYETNKIITVELSGLQFSNDEDDNL